ncbi:unnamed protein product [Chondrus crispus]|uniref:Uncharacterized protein n=1 Tax=Chondrus crispus TaxID=2769 RepID=R7QR50_CHOCR|nr:unnamed protein product [Chondrus crispus]CDF40238.1 unnamed protein product [Chondrus crispus]|eukprot:XP_005710532.1 unnamed protein product [Chondrus crispus]
MNLLVTLLYLLMLSVKLRKRVFWPRVCSDFLNAKLSNNAFGKTHSIPKLGAREFSTSFTSA